MHRIRGEHMDPKHYLKQYRESLDRTNEITGSLSELKAEAQALKDHEGQRVELDAAVAKYVDACEESANELDRLAVLRKNILSVIDEVEDPKIHSVLWRRYISGLTWEQVAVSMNYTYRRTTQLHGDALKIVAKILAKRT